MIQERHNVLRPEDVMAAGFLAGLLDERAELIGLFDGLNLVDLFCEPLSGLLVSVQKRGQKLEVLLAFERLAPAMDRKSMMRAGVSASTRATSSTTSTRILSHVANIKPRWSSFLSRVQTIASCSTRSRNSKGFSSAILLKAAWSYLPSGRHAMLCCSRMDSILFSIRPIGRPATMPKCLKNSSRGGRHLIHL